MSKGIITANKGEGEYTVSGSSTFIAVGLNTGALEEAGIAYLVFGGPDLPSIIHMSTLGEAGITFYGTQESGFIGRTLSSAGDINFDGIDDFIISSDSRLVVFILIGNRDLARWGTGIRITAT